MNTRLQDILFSLGLYYNPDRHAAPGYVRDACTHRQMKDDAIHFTSTYAIPYKIDDEGVRIIEFGHKDPALHDRDTYICSVDNLDIDKYRQIKAKWAVADMTARRASRELKAQIGRGFGLRTVEQYWTAINRANSPSPIESRGVGG